MPSRRLCKAAIIIALGLLPTASFAVCVDFDGGGRCIETGPVRSAPTPPPPSRVDPPPSSDRENPQQEQVKHKPPRPSTPSMKSVVTGTIVEGVFHGLFSPPARQAKPPGKAVTSVTSPGAGEIQRQFLDQENRDFLRSKNDLVNGMKGVGPSQANGSITLKAVPPSPPSGNTHSGFFGTQGPASPTVGLLREPLNGSKGDLLSPEEFRKALLNPDLTQEERDRLFLRTKVAPQRLEDHPMVDSRAFAEKERYSDLYLDIATAGGKAAATTVSLSLVDEAGKRVLEARGIRAGYDELLTAGKNSVERPQTTAARVIALGDYALTKAPTWSIAVDGAVNAGGAMTRQAIVRYWAARDSQRYYDPTPIATAKEKWNSLSAEQNDWTRALLDRAGAGEFK